MVFGYYKNLTVTQKREYRKSDEITSIKLPTDSELHPLIDELNKSLTEENREKIEIICQKLASALISHLNAPGIRVKVLAVRPNNSSGELHGIYYPAGDRSPANITVWMRTAQRRKVVAFRTFLRTLLHEICHHLDYEIFDLTYSFHTEGFYKRESSLFHQLVII